MTDLTAPLSSLPLALAAVLLSAFAHARQAEDQRPNIVVIMADDLGFSDLGCYGSAIETPHLDALAASGLRFSQFYSAGKCQTSRISLLTGLYANQAGAERLSHGATFAEVLGASGYFTAMVGKWHLKQAPMDFGFQRYFGHLSGSTNYFRGDETIQLNGEPWSVPEMLNGRPFYMTHAVADFSLQFLDEALESEQPFLMYVAFNAPHCPFQAPREAVGQYDGHFDEGWDVIRTRRHVKQLSTGLLPKTFQLPARAANIPAWDSLDETQRKWETDRMEVYAAMVDLMDQSVGRLVSALREKGALDNTLLLFLSDNGASPFDRTDGRNLRPWDEASHWTYDASWASVSNTPFRLYKRNQHEGGISSPLIVHWPHGLATPSGSISREQTHITDFMPTFIELAAARYPQTVGKRVMAELQGTSLVPIFTQKDRPARQQLYFHYGPHRALRDGSWKLVSEDLGPWELYNMDEDRTETNDLSAKHVARVKEMEEEWYRLARDLDRLPAGQLQPIPQPELPGTEGARSPDN